MPKPYEQDLRDRVLAAYDRGKQTKEIADTFGVSPAWARRASRSAAKNSAPRGCPWAACGWSRWIWNNYANSSSGSPTRPSPNCTSGWARTAAASRRWPWPCDGWASLLKKTIHAAEQDRPDVAEKRLRWKDDQPARAAPQLIFIDETWAKTNMTRRYGRAPVGERLVAKVPHGHWKTTTLIAALCTDGIRCSTVVDGAINADVFEAFVAQVLVPELRPGDVVVLDNLSSHKGARTRALVEGAGATLLFLPPYSPDLNPIELIFSKVKQALRSLACRTREALWGAMQGVLDRVTASDSVNCFRHCGYTLQLV